MKIKTLLPGLCLALPAAPAPGADGALPFGNTEACMAGPLAQFGRYVGNWSIRDWRLSQDGSEWLPGDGASWNFACLGNGTAIQDFWMDNSGNVGTNLRTWNDDTGAWDIAWAINSQPGFAHIEARQQENGNIVMQYKAPLPDPLRRITFFPPDAEGWDWRLEFSGDGGASWREVYRIRATRAFE